MPRYPSTPLSPHLIIFWVLLLVLGAGHAPAQVPDSFNPSADNSIVALAVQGDGKVLAGGLFSMLGGVPRAYVGRLNYDGTLDSGFNPGADSPVNCLALQPDGKLLVGGLFGTLAGAPCSYLGRLNSDGSLDSSFNAAIGFGGYVYGLAVQADGRIVSAGAFTTLGGQPCKYIGRLNPDGTLDTNFNSGASSPVTCLAVQADGNVVVGGSFNTLSGQPSAYLGRLNPDGSFDTNFTGSAGSVVNCLALQADGKILVGGSFTTLSGQACTNLGRLNSNGSFDPTFYYGADGPVYSLAIQADGRVLVGGNFATLGGLPCANLGRVNANGTLDSSFNPGANGTTFALTLQPDGLALAGGAFTSLATQTRPSIGRLSNTVAASQSLSFGGSTVTWSRGASSPEVWRTTFDVTTDGNTWSNLGSGVRISGGWQLTNVLVATNASLRARGFVAGSEHNGSGWFAESIIGPAVINEQPTSLTNNAGTVAVFSVAAGGTAPLSYRWQKDGVALSDTGGISGSQTPMLTLSNVLNVNVGGYSAIVSDSFGSVTSKVATLRVIDPVITTSPVSQEVNAGQTVVFSSSAYGTAPLSYQWRKNITNYLSGATGSSLTLLNVLASDSGSYDVVVSNSVGAVTSDAALLTVDVATVDSFAPQPNATAFCIAQQSDGKVLASGLFTNLAGNLAKSIGRLNPDGSIDTNFTGSANTFAYALAIQPDGKIIAAGGFTNISGLLRNHLGRLNADGSADTNFVGGAGGTVYALALQPDGKLIAGGSFSTLAGLPWNNLGRLNPDGTLDTNFLGSASGTVYTLALQPDGRILAGGAFGNLSGLSRTNIGRLNADGSPDTSFVAGANSTVTALALQADGQILAGGGFTSLNGFSRSHIARVSTNGTIDATFSPVANNYIVSFAIQTDGKIIAGGNFTSLGGSTRNFLGRMNTNGTLDTAFNPAPAGTYVYGLGLQADSKLLVAGSFSTLGGQSRSNLARLNNSPSVVQTLTCDGSKATWLRSGAGPEVWRTTFESSTDGVHWSMLGAGTRISGGWQVAGLSVSSGAFIRARGYTTGGYWNGSSWFVESDGAVTNSASNLVILVNDGSFGMRSNRFGFNVSATAGKTVVIDATTNFINWIPLQTNIVTGSALVSFSDPQSGLFPSRFYRARFFNGALPSPYFLTAPGSIGFQNGQFGMSVSGIGGQTVLVLASTNLANWVPLATNVLGNSPLLFSDQASTNFTRRFYRLQVQ